jgi:CRP/FNR family transcriptional regulator
MVTARDTSGIAGDSTSDGRSTTAARAYHGRVTRPSAAAVAALPLFQRVSADDCARIAAAAQLRSFGRGDRLFDEGDPPGFFVVVVTGRVKVYKHRPDGQDVILEIFGPGFPIGAVAIWELRPYPATAEALDAVECLFIPRAEFLALLEEHPSLVRGLLSSMSHRLVELTSRLGELAGARVESRFARLFLKLADRLGRDERGGVFIPLPLSRQELADLTGTTIETAIRVMSRWGKQDVLRTEKDGFVVVDASTLQTFAAGS